MTIMAIATANKDKSRVHRKVSQPKFKMNIVDEKSSSSSKLPKHIHPSDHEKEENASDLQQQRELMKALRVANLNASLLTAKLAVESKKTDIDNNQYDPDMTKILDNIVGALDVARTFSKSTQMYERMQRRSPAA